MRTRRGSSSGLRGKSAPESPMRSSGSENRDSAAVCLPRRSIFPLVQLLESRSHGIRIAGRYVNPFPRVSLQLSSTDSLGRGSKKSMRYLHVLNNKICSRNARCGKPSGLSPSKMENRSSFAHDTISNRKHVARHN